MPVISSTKDVEKLTLTFVAEFAAAPDRIWQVWADPRQLERWWGPPTWPATFERHDFTVGGDSRYYMTGPEGQKARAWWTVTAIEAPHRLEFTNGFADDNGEPLDPTDVFRTVVTLEATTDGTRMTTVEVFAHADQMERLIGMGMDEGVSLAMGQIDGLLADAD
ncbi:SRPBCC family protein [Mangrovihabitans endophyticus]|uniref:Activator of HSP90 ATPase n=1 Tax=Mangrovihabitans endophyticus TaxID=1751298 RepID=A0A8J3C292_9ACTN|nr:SRPBCC domain-containing protein [Mangrovihabitans endophyticus]GGL04660.1 activator of HSP90 ATPase [Mangrovihabitans endophyticus]